MKGSLVLKALCALAIAAIAAVPLISVKAEEYNIIYFDKTSPVQGNYADGLTYTSSIDKLFSGSMGAGGKLYRYNSDWTQGENPYDGFNVNTDVLDLVGLASDGNFLYQINKTGAVSKTTLEGNRVDTMHYVGNATGGDYFDNGDGGKLYLTTSTQIHRGSLGGGVEKVYTLSMDISPISDIIFLGKKDNKPLVLGATTDGVYFEGTLNDDTNTLDIIDYGEFNSGGIDDLAFKLLSPSVARAYAGFGGSIGQFTPPIQPDSPYRSADFDNNYKVDSIDLKHFVDFYLTQGDPNASEGTDFDRNGIVNLKDYSVLSGQWSPAGYQPYQ